VTNPWLLLGGCLSAGASLLHLACIAGGPDWYRALGAGEGMARAAERGDWRAAGITTVIALVLGTASAYAFSGAGLIARLPLLKLGLVVITAVYLLRGLVLFMPSALARPDLSTSFLIWSSAIVLAFGIIHAVGTWRAWQVS
jgi:hypothetical protein